MMKTYATLLVVLFIPLACLKGQIPNNGFEDWSVQGIYEDPDGWATMNAVCTGPFFSATKSTDHYPPAIGNHAVKIECNTSLTQATGGWGVIVTNAFDYPFKPAFPITGHPEKLWGYAKYIPENGDQAVIRVILFLNGTEVINNATTITGTGMTWQPFSVEFDPYTAADSATIMIMAWMPIGSTSPPNGNSVLFIDNLSFDNLITETPETPSIGNSISLHPNPASEHITLNTAGLKGDPLTVKFFDLRGTLIMSETILKDSESRFNLKDFQDGVYIITVSSAQTAWTQRLVVQHQY